MDLEKSICKSIFSQTITLANAQPLKITLGEDTQVLDEVVVTALGIKRATKALSYNVQEVKGDELTAVKDANFMNSLSGKVAGVQINSRCNRCWWCHTCCYAWYEISD